MFAAQSFETGADTGGYVISEVQIWLSDIAGKTTLVRIRKNDGGEPGDLVATLTSPGTLTSDSLNTFAAPPDKTLDADTTYWFTLSEGSTSFSNNVSFQTISDDAETGESGWSIGDEFLWRISASGSWSESGASLLIAIKGTINEDTATNTPATGKPAISGTAQVGQTLTASTIGIMDADGLPTGFTYQWVRLDGSTETDIAGETSSTYMPSSSASGPSTHFWPSTRP